jgi:RimJ/RimL family protein N-acetyltransferase
MAIIAYSNNPVGAVEYNFAAMEMGPGEAVSVLVTDRLRLEPITEAHATEIAPVLDDQRLHAFIGGRPLTESELRVRYRRLTAGRSDDGRERWLNWIVRVRQDGHAIGVVQATVTGAAHPRAELSWVVAPGVQGHGYAREAAAAMLAWLIDEGIAEFVAHIHPGHIASQRVARALGLAATGTIVAGEVEWTASRAGRT